MAGVKGRSGTNKGKDKLFADAIRIAVNEEDPVTKKRKIRLIAEKVVALAVEGESWACQQVADRLDGKPAQEQTVTLEDKRDASDWTRDELVSVLNELREGGSRASEKAGRCGEPDSVH